MDANVGTGGFGAWDWAVLSAYGMLLVGTGWWLARRKPATSEDYFLGGRSMPVWAVAVSVLATSMSAATFIGGPEQAYRGNLTYLSSNIGMILAAVVIAVWFVPAFYKHRVATVYELLEVRMGRGARVAASAAFMLGRVFASGARLYIVALPAALILFGEQPDGSVADRHLMIAIAAMTVVGVCYTLAGGVSSVIWSDVVQTVVFVGAVVAAVVVLMTRIPVGAAEIGDVLRAQTVGDGGDSKLTMLSLSTDPHASYTLWTALIGFTLMGIASYGTDHDLAQRLLTCKSAARGSWSIISANLVSIPVVLVFLVAGLLLYVFYARPDVMGASAPGYAVNDQRKIFLSFILHEMPGGMRGLMMAGLFAAGLSSLNSALNAMASTFVEDFVRRHAPGVPERRLVVVGRVAVVGWGVVLGVFACGCIAWHDTRTQTLIDFALGVMVYAYAGLVGVFCSAILTKRGSSVSAIASVIVGFASVFALNSPTTWAAIARAINVFSPGEGGLDPSRPLAFPWVLTVSSLIAFGVCQLGSRRASLAAPEAA